MSGLFWLERHSPTRRMQEGRCNRVGRFLLWSEGTLTNQETMRVVPFGGVFRTGVRLPSSPQKPWQSRGFPFLRMRRYVLGEELQHVSIERRRVPKLTKSWAAPLSAVFL
jgi:hypothetical protein